MVGAISANSLPEREWSADLLSTLHDYHVQSLMRMAEPAGMGTWDESALLACHPAGGSNSIGSSASGVRWFSVLGCHCAVIVLSLCCHCAVIVCSVVAPVRDTQRRAALSRT